MLSEFEELARMTGAELTEALIEIERIECLGAAFTGSAAEFQVGWMIHFGWTSIPASLIVSEADVERGEDWLIERFTLCILDQLASLRAFTLSDVEAVA